MQGAHLGSLPLYNMAEQDGQAIGYAHGASQTALAGVAAVRFLVVGGLHVQAQQARAVYLLEHHRTRTERLR